MSITGEALIIVLLGLILLLVVSAFRFRKDLNNRKLFVNAVLIFVILVPTLIFVFAIGGNGLFKAGTEVPGSKFVTSAGAPMSINSKGEMFGVGRPMSSTTTFPTHKAVLKSTNDWSNAAEIQSMEKILNIWALESGAVLVSKIDGTIYRIDEKTGIMSKVFEFTGPYIHVCREFSIHSSGQKVLLGEYGDRGYARKVFFSTDDGKTFRQIFELPYNTEHHIHSVHYDKYTDQIWVTQGDYHNQQIYVSEPPYNKFMPIYHDQPTVICATPTHVLFGKDYGPDGSSGILRYDRATGKFDQPLEFPVGDDYCYPCWSMLYDEKNDTVYFATDGTSKYMPIKDTAKFGIWRSKAPYDKWTKIAEITKADGYTGFQRLAGIWNNVLYACVITDDYQSLTYEAELTSRFKNIVGF